METKIRYKKFHIWFPITVGAALILTAVVSQVYARGSWTVMGLLPLGALYLGRGLHARMNGFARLGTNYLVRTGIIPDKIYWQDIERVKKFAGDWIVTYKGGRELFFITGMIDPGSWAAVENYMAILAERKATVPV